MFYINDAQRRAVFAHMFSKKKSRYLSPDDEAFKKLKDADKPVELGKMKFRELYNMRRDINHSYKEGLIDEEERDYMLSQLNPYLRELGRASTVSPFEQELFDAGVAPELTMKPQPTETFDPLVGEQVTQEDKDALKELLGSKMASVYLKADEKEQKAEAKFKEPTPRQQADLERSQLLLGKEQAKQEFELEAMKEKTKQTEAETREFLKMEALKRGAPVAGYGARLALETGKTAALAPVHVAGRVAAPPVRGARRVLTLPARALGGAASGLKGTVGFAGEQAASVLHDFGIAAQKTGGAFGKELATGVNRFFGSGRGVTREMSDPFLRSYHTQTAMIRPIGGFEMPRGIQRFEPRQWGGQSI